MYNTRSSKKQKPLRSPLKTTRVELATDSEEENSTPPKKRYERQIPVTPEKGRDVDMDDGENEDMFKTPPRRGRSSVMSDRQSSRRNTAPRKRRSFESRLTPSTALAGLNIGDNHKEPSGLFEELDLFQTPTGPTTQERFAAAVTEPRPRPMRRLGNPQQPKTPRSGRKPRSRQDPWDRAIKRNPGMAEWLEQMQKDLERAESTELSIVEELRQEQTRDVRDWLNKTM